MAQKQKSLDLFIFVDALGWRIVQERGLLRGVLPYQKPCRSLFGYSSTCDPTILTGALPREHGHFSFFVPAAPGESPFQAARWLGWLPHRLAGHHRVRNRISRWYAKKLGYTGYFQLYSVPFSKLADLDYTEKRDIYESGGIIGGQPAIFEHWERSGKAWFRSDWRRGDEANIAQCRQLISEGAIELGYLFTARLDALMHRYGTRAAQLDTAFAQWEEQMVDLMTLAQKKYTSARFYIFSDHGMADVTQCSDLLPRWQKMPWRWGRDYFAVWDSTMVRWWFPGGEAVSAEVAQWLGEQPDGRIVSEEELARWGCNFPDQRYGELFYLLPQGGLFVPSFMNLGKVTGMHGYAPEEEDSWACWLTNAEIENAPEGLEDIFGVMQAVASA